MRSASILAALALLTASFALAHPMVSPEIDIEKPFCYYSRPTDQLGTIVCRSDGRRLSVGAAERDEGTEK